MEPIRGTKTPENETIAGSRIIRRFEVFIGGVSNRINEEHMKLYMETELGVTPISITLNRENEFNRSYRVSVSNSEKDKIFNPSLWDNNIIIKPFRKKRIYSNVDHLVSNGGITNIN